MSRELRCDVLVVGGGVGGVSAALAALDGGVTVILTEETDWVGGQFTSQAVPPDEHKWIEQVGATEAYQRFRRGVRDFYRANYPLTARAASTLQLNPGAGRVSGLSHEPRVSLAVLESMLAPWESLGRLTVLRRTVLAAATTTGDRVGQVELTSLEDGASITVSADYILDATETGELLPAAGIEYVTGTESRDDTGEAHAAEVANPQNMQPVTVCFAVSHHEGENHVIEKPGTYDYWRAYRPAAWQGEPQLGWTAPHRITHDLIPLTFQPNPPFDPTEGPTATDDDLPDRRSLWLFRRILARGHLQDPSTSDITLVNWAANDYLEGNLFEADAEAVAGHDRAARQLSLSLLYWLQTEAPRHDGGTGYPGLRVRPDVTGTADGLAKTAYHRESRRIEALTRVVEQDVSATDRDAIGVRHWDDSVGIGSYRIDLHPSTAGDNYIDIPAHPFEIPLGALIPRRVRNVLAAAKNIGTTHVTNGCYRLHPVEWNIGEAAGALAAYCVAGGYEPHQVRENAELLASFQARLTRSGVALRWPEFTSY